MEAEPTARQLMPLQWTVVRSGAGLRLIFYVIVGIWVDALFWMSGAPMHGAALLAPIFGAAIVTLAGEVLLALFGMRSLSAPLAAAFVIGGALSSIAALVPTLLWQWPADMAFLLWSAIVIAAGGLVGQRFDAAGSTIERDVVATASFALFVGFFARHQMTALPTLLQTSVLPAWVDYFIHGNTIVSFGDPAVARSGDIMLSGAPRIAYHYAPFILPAALSQISSLCGLGLATAILLPLGLLIGMVGLYGLAREWASFRIAILAVSLVASLPDASTYFFKNGFFGFQWLIFTAPGSAYAIGLAAIAYACLIRWFSDRRFGTLALAALLTLMLIPVRVHMFFLAAPAFASAVMLDLLAPRWRAPVVIIIALIATALTLLLVQGIAFDSYGTQFALPFAYIQDVLSFGPEPYARTIIDVIVQRWGKAAAALPAALILLFTTLGLWAAAFPLVFSCLGLKSKRAAADVVPVLLCCTYVLLIFWAPVAQNGSLDEYKHRHFPLLYAIIVLWTLLRLVRLAQEGAWLSKANAVRAGVSGAAALAATLVAERNIDPAKPRDSLRWAATYYDVGLDPGVASAATFIRNHGQHGDIIAVDVMAAHETFFSLATELSSMADMPIYVARADMEMRRGGKVARTVEARLADIKAVETSSDIADAFGILRTHAIRWYVVVTPALPHWDESGGGARYHSGLVYVYDASASD
jgi:hypothetical protein